jgi:TonB family protein
VDVLRSTPPFTDVVVSAVRTWKFSPALDGVRKPMDTRILIDAVIGAPSLNVPTVGTPPKDVSPADSRVPFPSRTSAPAYPVNVRSEGSVLVETRVDPAGRVVGVTAVRSAPPFDTAAMDAARAWTFRPAQGAAAPPSTLAYLLFVFRQPVMSPTARPKQ